MPRSVRTAECCPRAGCARTVPNFLNNAREHGRATSLSSKKVLAQLGDLCCCAAQNAWSGAGQRPVPATGVLAARATQQLGRDIQPAPFGQCRCSKRRPIQRAASFQQNAVNCHFAQPSPSVRAGPRRPCFSGQSPNPAASVLTGLPAAPAPVQHGGQNGGDFPERCVTTWLCSGVRKWVSQRIRMGLRPPAMPAGQQGVIRQHGADSRHDAAIAVTILLDAVAGLLRR